jgi:hypothetical protein
MLILGAMFNYYEHDHNDLIVSQQIFLEELKISITSSTKSLQEIIEEKKTNKNLKISCNKHSASYYQALLINKKDNCDSKVMIDDAISILKKIENKIKYDHEVRPLMLFWIKADYFLVAKILALVGSLISVAFIYFISHVNFDRYVKPLLYE